MRIERIGPIITPTSHPAAGTNINGPSLVRVPDWVDDPLGRYYLYFADHKGDSIRLAYANQVTGPYTFHPGGALGLAASRFPTTTPQGIEPRSEIQRQAIEAEGYNEHFTPHIASPDVIVDHEHQRIWMAYHGLCADGTQLTRMAWSTDGRHFEADEPLVAFPYLRILPEPRDGVWLAMSMPGVVYRSTDLRSWEAGPMLFDINFRHCAITRRGPTLHVLWTRVGDAPEHLLHSTIEIGDNWSNADWTRWSPSEPVSVLYPDEPWEGADLPVEPSVRGQVTAPVCQLRDPAILDDGGRTWLLYCIAGESGIALAEITNL
ncbi:MAG: hypothetical protein AAFY28_15230 [Actinomycetota bacterium]